MDSREPPASRRAWVSDPSGATWAVHSSHPSHGMFGRSQRSHASVSSVGESRGSLKKSASGGQRLQGPVGEGDRTQRVDRVVVAGTMVLDHAEHAVPRGVDPEVREPERGRVRNGLRLGADGLAIESVVVEVREHDDAVADRV